MYHQQRACVLMHGRRIQVAFLSCSVRFRSTLWISRVDYSATISHGLQHFFPSTGTWALVHCGCILFSSTRATVVALSTIIASVYGDPRSFVVHYSSLCTVGIGCQSSTWWDMYSC
jgi:hypothetical protein